MGAEDTAMNKTGKRPVPTELSLQQGREPIHRVAKSYPTPCLRR